jgi:hypothetical protein
MTRISIAAKLIQPELWEGALIIDGKFQRSYTGSTLMEVTERALLALWAPKYSPGTSVVLEVVTEEGEPDAGGH